MKPDASRTVYDGTLVDVTLERWGDHEREIVEHPGAVAVVAVDAGDELWLVRQLREPARRQLVELPAGTRERHRGVSHHTRAVVELATPEALVAWPAGADAPDWLTRREEVDAGRWREACAGLPLEHMGRGPDDDPLFFESAFAAGALARRLTG